jgi:predicted PurR-regulated permease PerM
MHQRFENHKVTVSLEENSLWVILQDLYSQLTTQQAKLGFRRFDEYLTLSVVMMLFFAFVFSFIYFVCDKVLCRGTRTVFQKMDRAKKSEYVGRIVSVLHAVIVSVTSTIGCFFIW